MLSRAPLLTITRALSVKAEVLIVLYTELETSALLDVFTQNNAWNATRRNSGMVTPTTSRHSNLSSRALRVATLWNKGRSDIVDALKAVAGSIYGIYQYFTTLNSAVACWGIIAGPPAR
jgi:hypothetical protein